MTEIPFTRRVSIPEQVLIQHLDGEAVLLNLETETYFGLDEVGARIWTLLEGSDSIQAAYEALLEEYEVEPEPLRADLAAFLVQLLEHRLIELGAEPTGQERKT